MYKREQRGLLTVIVLGALITGVLWYVDRDGGTAPDAAEAFAAAERAHQQYADSVNAAAGNDTARVATRRKRRRGSDSAKPRSRRREHENVPPRQPLDELVPAIAHQHDNQTDQ